MTAGNEAGAFWRFSLMVYARPGVANALLSLQDRGGHNVNLILFALWLGVCEGSRLDAAGLARAKAAMTGLDRDVVAPLRQLRRGLRENADPDVRALRQRVLALEIAAERRVQARLAVSAAPRRKMKTAEPRALAEANLRLILGADFGAAETAIFLSALFPPTGAGGGLI